MLKIILLGVLHVTGVFAHVTEIHVPQQDRNVVHLVLRSALQSDAVIVFELHLGVSLLILHSPVYELWGKTGGLEVAEKEAGSSRAMTSLQPTAWMASLSRSRKSL